MSTSWLTPYGRIDALFWTTQSASQISDADDDVDNKTDDLVAVKIVIIPAKTTSASRIEFNLTLQEAYSYRFLVATKVSYQAMVPDDAKIFSIAMHSQVEDLENILRNGTARLTDRDTKGRSLLAVGHAKNSETND